MQGLKNRDIVCLAGSDWDTPLWTNRQHIMSRLSKDNRILYIESIGIRGPNLFHRADLAKMLKKVKRVFQPLRKEKDGLYVLTPFLIPSYKYPVLVAVNKWLLKHYVDSALKRLAFKDPVLWGYLPHALWLAEERKFKAVLYHCVDDYRDLPGVARDLFIEMEDEFTRKCDLVFVTSNKLFESKKALNRNIHYLPNVADFAHFSKSSDPATVVPEDLSAISRPIIGYIGNLADYKIDIELVAHIAHERPCWSIVLIGPTWGKNVRISKMLHDLQRQKNVYFPGSRAYDMLPNYIKGFDVCIIPHVTTGYSHASFPMKFFEFLASGKPTVVTALDSLKEYAEYVYSAGTLREFIQKIDEALQENDSKKRDARIGLASRNTWETRIRSMEDIIIKSPDKETAVIA